MCRLNLRVGGLLGLAVLLAGACSHEVQEPPALVVYVVIDQLRADLVERYDSLFTGGLRRVLDDGMRFTQVTHDHANTETAVGHAVLSTGAHPSRNGIVANQWLERTTDGWRSVYSVEDTMAHILGHPAMAGRSPSNLLRGGLADWVVAADSGALVVSVSRKDRAAIAMAGRTRGHVYWITPNEGRFVTSSFYADRYPPWVEGFNRAQMPRIFGDSVWEQTIPVSARRLTRPDSASYEGDGVHTYFPHRFEEEGGNPSRSGALNRWAFEQVYPDAAVAEFAAVAIKSLHLGQDAVTDYLGVSFSQTDAVGHAYGPLSREQLENLLHVDRVLGELMATLDESVGEGRWVMAVTADHGVLTIPEYLAECGGDASRAGRDNMTALRRTFAAFRDKEGDPLAITDELVAALESLPFVEDALTVPELTSGPPADSFVVLMRNSYHPDRWAGEAGSEGLGVLLRYEENLYPTSSSRGTGHGSPYYYDRHVPLIFFGSGVSSGVSDSPVRAVDIAPTLARLAGISAPDDLDGRPILE